MRYNINMTKKLRSIIFWLTVGLFFLISPIAILYALDYSYDWQTKKLVQNGAFYLKSVPKNAKIFINGKSKKTTPRLIKKLLPRDYAIEIKKEGYQAWKKTLRIESGLVTENKYVLLIPDKPILEQIADNIIDLEDYLNNQAGQNEIAKKQEIQKKFAASFKFSDIKIILSDGQPSAILVNNATSTLHYSLYLLSDDTFQLLAEGVNDAEFSSDNKKLLWQTDNEIWVYWLDSDYIQPQRKKGNRQFITRFSEKIKQVTWESENNRHIIFTVGDAIKIIELDDRDQKNIMNIATLPNPQIAYKNKNLYILSENKVYRFNLLEDSLF